MGIIDLSGILQTVTSAADIVLVNPQVNKGITAQLPEKLKTATPDYLGIIFPPLAKEQPQQHFLFDYTGEDTVSLTSDITDHYTEDNTALQDQISLKPVTITTQGYIAELNDIAPIVPELLKFAQQKLTSLSPFIPGITSAAQRGYNTALQVYSTANLAVKSVVAARATITSLGQAQPVQTKQQKAFVQFYQYWQDRTLFTVQTPYAIFKDMAILTLKASQDEDSNTMSTFEVTFKKMNFAQTITATNASGLSHARAQAQKQLTQDRGISKPTNGPGVRDLITSSGLL